MNELTILLMAVHGFCRYTWTPIDVKFSMPSMNIESMNCPWNCMYLLGKHCAKSRHMGLDHYLKATPRSWGSHVCHWCLIPHERFAQGRVLVSLIGFVSCVCSSRVCCPRFCLSGLFSRLCFLVVFSQVVVLFVFATIIFLFYFGSVQPTYVAVLGPKGPGAQP